MRIEALRHLASAAILIGAASGTAAQDWQLVWQDEFDGTSIDTTKWEHEVNAWGGGNNELQYYTDRPENSFVEDGHLVIQAIKETYTGVEGTRAYTSARLRTKNRGDWTYGRFEARAKLPIGQGLWPAIWMLPTDETYGGWAASGEIDIMEMIGHEPSKLHGSLHFGGAWPNNQSTTAATNLEDGTFNDDYHVFALEWKEGQFRWYLDDKLYSIKSSWSTEGADYPAPFDQRFHLLLNVAVGGNWPGSPDSSTEFPQRMEVDYVRVYQIAQPTDTEERPEGATLLLHQSYPNPFSNEARVVYSLPESGDVTLELIDLFGRVVDRPVDERQLSGTHEIVVNADRLAAGPYVLRLESGGASRSSLITLIR